MISWLWPAVLSQGCGGEAGRATLCARSVSQRWVRAGGAEAPIATLPREGFSRTCWPSACLAPVLCNRPPVLCNRPPCTFCLTPSQSVPLCQQESGKLQHEKHLVAPTRHIPARLPPCSCSQPGQTLAAAAKYSQASSQSLVVTQILARASLHRQQASREQHAQQ